MRVSLSYGTFTGHHARDPTEDQDGRDLHDAESLQTPYTGRIAGYRSKVRVLRDEAVSITVSATDRIKSDIDISLVIQAVM